MSGRIIPYASLLVELELENFGLLRLDVLLPETMRGLRRHAWRVARWGLSVSDVLDTAQTYNTSSSDATCCAKTLL